MKKLVARNPLFFAFLFPALVDGIFTLVGQDASFWSGGKVNEASPAYYVLLISPWLFVIGSIVWLAFWYWVFKKIKEPINLFLTILFITGHAWGSASWIWKVMRDNGVYTPENQISVISIWSIVVIYFVIIALSASYSLRIYFRGER